MQLTHATPLEQSIMRLHTDNSENKEWFYGTVVSILEDGRLPYFTKTDRLASAFLSIDARITYVKEQTKLLQHLKKQLEQARVNAKVEVAKAFGAFGISKLEGVQVSSISVNPATETRKTKLRILNADALIKAGYFTVVVDEKAVEEALYSADQRHEVEAYVDATVEKIEKPATVRINKRKSVSSDSIHIEAA